MDTVDEPRQIYDSQAQQWSRDQPLLLSDYSARPFLLEMCEPVSSTAILDLGCGEGYVARELMKRGAASILGIDLSGKMIEVARARQDLQPCPGLAYAVSDLRDLDPSDTSLIDDEQFDLAIAVFLFNYMTLEETGRTLQKIYQALKPGGRLVFAVPHPSLPFLNKEPFPFHFQNSGGYFSGRGNRFPGEIWRRDRVPVSVQCVHKTVEDYFQCLQQAGFNRLPDVHELKITEQQIALDPGFFGPLKDLPLHLAFRIFKS